MVCSSEAEREEHMMSCFKPVEVVAIANEATETERNGTNIIEEENIHEYVIQQGEQGKFIYFI